MIGQIYMINGLKKIFKIMRTIKDLLELMIDHQELFYSGLCYQNRSLNRKNLIGDLEYLDLQAYINTHRPSKYSSLQAYNSKQSGFYWSGGDIKPRIKWLKKHIKKNS